MKFHDKLLVLRKAQGMSQEDLAVKLETTRQAISKWENGLGYPETEKLIVLSNVFQVSIDFLLKDQEEMPSAKNDTHYVSKEEGDGFIKNEIGIAALVANGVCLLFLASIPYTMLRELTPFVMITTTILILSGVGFILSGAFLDDEKYNVIKQNPLSLETKYQSELETRYKQKVNRCKVCSIIGIMMIVLGLLPLLFSKEVAEIQTYRNEFFSFGFLFIGIGLWVTIRFGTIMETYELLLHNDRYSGKAWVQLVRKFRKKIHKIDS